MIKKIILFSALFLTVQFFFGQEIFRKGQNAVTFGGGYKIIGTMAPAVNVSFERSIFTKREKGSVGIGLFAEMLFTDSVMSPVVTVRTAFHLGSYRTKLIDPYIGIGLAFAPQETTNFYPDVFIGSRFKFNNKKKFGLFAEAGFYSTNIRAGVCWIW